MPVPSRSTAGVRYNRLIPAAGCGAPPAKQLREWYRLLFRLQYNRDGRPLKGDDTQRELPFVSAHKLRYHGPQLFSPAARIAAIKSRRLTPTILDCGGGAMGRSAGK